MRNRVRVFAVAGVGAIACWMRSACGGADTTAFTGQLSNHVNAPVSGSGSPNPVIRPRIVVVEPATGNIDG